MKPERKILLNPGPATTADEVKFAMVVPDICPREREFCDIMQGIKEDLPKVVNGGEDYTSVLFASSGTGGIEAAVTSAIPADGKILVIDNGAYGARMAAIPDAFRIPNVKYRLAYGDYPDLGVIEQYLKDDPAITHIGIIDHETTTGMRNPVQGICDLARRYGKQTIVDCMSSFAGLPIDLQKWQADYIVSSSNKCIQGMAGLSFVIFKKSLLPELKANRNLRSFYFDIYSQFDGFQSTGQMSFTPPVQVVYALRKAMDMFFEETAEGRISRYRRNYEILRDGLLGLGFGLLLDEEYQSGLLVAVKEPDDPAYGFDTLHDYMYARGYTIYPGKGAKERTFRLSVLGDLYEGDIRGFMGELKNFLAEYGIDPR